MRILSAMADKIPIVVILGATGAGKSKLALELAQRFGGEIISADAVQMYKGLDIITNKVTPEEQSLVKHHMIDILDSQAVNSVVDFRSRALPIVENLLRQGRIPVICGGTNYYIESLLWKVLIDEETPFLVQNKRKSLEAAAESQTVKRQKNEDVGPGLGLVDENGEPSLRSVDYSKEDDESVSTDLLYQFLQQIDPARSERLHPRERRKIWRSLQIWQQYGVRHSDLISSQGGVLGGGLRFPAERICIIEVWSDQDTLDKRCDSRVDKMIERGMVEELNSFHQAYNKERRKLSDDSVDYTKGIFQSIGFKEFHSYLQLKPEDRETERGKEEFNKGVQLLKIATRQYARRQTKWMRKRFLLDSREAPPVYRVDSSNPDLWKDRCFLPAFAILQAFLDGRRPEVEPLARFSLEKDEFADNRRTFHCDMCERDFSGSKQYKDHLSGKKHGLVVKQKLQQEPPISLVLAKIDENKRTESIKILKNSFEIPVIDIMKMIQNLPCEIAQMKPRSKAVKLKKCLAKHGIQLEMVETTCV